ncbi:MAG: hypothetical protein WCP57_11880 [Bacteroidota bacterium]
MRQVVVYLFICLWFLQSFFGVVYYTSIRRVCYTTFIAKRQDKKYTHILSFAKEDKINWEKNGKEFIRNGELYDVLKIDTINDKYIIYAYADSKESKALEHYTALELNKNKNNSSKNKTIIIDFLKYMTPINQFDYLTYFKNILLFYKNTSLNKSYIQSCPSPPPELV